MAVDDVCVLRAVGRYQSQNIVNTMHFKITAQTSTELAVLGSLNLAWWTEIRTDWLACHIDTYALIGLKAFRVNGAAKTPDYKVVGLNGTVTDTEVPSNIAQIITLYTASANFRRRGRLMLSGCGAGMFNTVDGSFTTVQVGIMQDLADTLALTLTNGGDDFEMCIPPANGSPTELITAFVARNTPGAISSRRIKRFFIG